VSPGIAGWCESADRCSELVGVPRAFGMLVGHSPSAIFSLPAFVSRSPPDNSCMYPSLISRSLCSTGIRWCTAPFAQSRNETNSSWVNGGDKPCAIPRICDHGGPVQASYAAQTDPLPATTMKGSIAGPARVAGEGSGRGLSGEGAAV
jgi:hypothetical protein